MRRVQQLDDMGCGVACVAMLTGQSYSAIRDLMYPNGPDTIRGTHGEQLRHALACFGCKTVELVRFKKGTRYQSLTFDAVLKVGLTKRSVGGHWVVWDSERRRVLDPDRQQAGRYRPTSYLQVTRPDDYRIWPREVDH